MLDFHGGQSLGVPVGLLISSRNYHGTDLVDVAPFSIGFHLVRENQTGELAIHYRDHRLLFRELKPASTALSEEMSPSWPQ